MKNRIRNGAIATVGCAWIACAAHALPQSAFWMEVPVVDDPLDSADLSGFRSFDLFVQLDLGDFIYATDSGIIGDGLSYNPAQTVFLHPDGDDTGVDPALLSLHPDLAFDTRSQMGSLPYGSFGAPVGPWTFGGGQIVGVTSANVPTPGGAAVDAAGAFWFGRFTLSSAGAFGENTSSLGEYLGGQVFLSFEHFGSLPPEAGIVDVPNVFVPAPGAASVFAVVGVVRARRRRL